MTTFMPEPHERRRRRRGRSLQVSPLLVAGVLLIAMLIPTGMWIVPTLVSLLQQFPLVGSLGARVMAAVDEQFVDPRFIVLNENYLSRRLNRHGALVIPTAGNSLYIKVEARGAVPRIEDGNLTVTLLFAGTPYNGRDQNGISTIGSARDKKTVAEVKVPVSLVAYEQDWWGARVRVRLVPAVDALELFAVGDQALPFEKRRAFAQRETWDERASAFWTPRGALEDAVTRVFKAWWVHEWIRADLVISGPLETKVEPDRITVALETHVIPGWAWISFLALILLGIFRLWVLFSVLSAAYKRQQSETAARFRLYQRSTPAR